jgi:O-antigen/teichoic acid export membrane protein
MNTAPHLFRNLLWNHSGRILEYGLAYVTSVLIARGLGVSGNGEFAALMSFMQLALVLSSAGLETSLNKFIPQMESSVGPESRYLLRRALAFRLGILAVIALLLAAVKVMDIGPFPGVFISYAAIVVELTILRSLVSLLVLTTVAQLRTPVAATINVTTRLLECGGIALLTVIGIDIGRILAVYITASVIQIGAYVVAARGLVLGSEKPISVRPMFVFGGIYFLNNIVDYFLGRHGDVLFLRTLLHESGQASLYDVAFSVMQAGLFAATVGFSGVTFAAFSRLAVASAESVPRFYMFIHRVMTLLTILPAAFLLFHAETIIRLIYPTQYSGAIFLLQGMAAWRIGIRLFGGGENCEFLLARGRVALFVGMSFLGALTNIVLNLILIPHLGAHGSVIASGAGNLVAVFATFLLVRSNGRISWQPGMWLKATVAGCGASGIALLMRSSTPALSLVLEGGAYLVCWVLILLLLKPLKAGDVEWFAKIDPRLDRLLAKFSSGI